MLLFSPLLALALPLPPRKLLMALLLLGPLALLLFLLLAGLLLTLPAAAPLVATRALSLGLLTAG